MVKDKDLQIQENISEDKVIDKLSCECCNGDREKGRIVYQEVLKVVREKNSKTKTRTTTRTRTRTKISR
jgi:type II secretory ATPase GspE/PulE/Tfp pilus assembly ATPase PilB-like protein